MKRLLNLLENIDIQAGKQRIARHHFFDVRSYHGSRAVCYRNGKTLPHLQERIVWLLLEGLEHLCQDVRRL